VIVPDGGVDGVICAQGGRYGGWALYCVDGRLAYCHSAGAPPLSHVRTDERLAPGSRVVRFEFVWDGGTDGGTAALYVDDVRLAEGRIEQTIKHFVVPDTAPFAVGTAPLTSINEEIRPRGSAFTGTIEWVRIDAEAGAEIDADEDERAALAAQ
jgi:arylsulfatase